MQLINIAKSFAERNVLQSINLHVEKGEFFALLGPSGCGKTTLLRLIAGLETADCGRILIGDKEVQNLPANLRPCHTVFQSYALFPHLTVADNVAFPLVVKKLPAAEIKARVSEALELVELSAQHQQNVTTLSGGQQQRVALARALVGQPELVLLDEPLSALDFKLRQSMRQELKKLQKQLGLTFVFVTHDQDEALSMADRIAVMQSGCVEQVGTPEAIYLRPATHFVADFVGRANKSPTSRETNATTRLIRPENMRLYALEHRANEDEECCIGRVEQIHFRGSHIDYRILNQGDNQSLVVSQMLSQLAAAQQWEVGQTVQIVWRRADVLMLGR